MKQWFTTYFSFTYTCSRKVWGLILLVGIGMLLGACKDDLTPDPNPDPDPDPIYADRTVLVYMAVSNLTTQADLNLADMTSAMEGVSGNLIAYVNRYPGNAVLYRINDDLTMTEVAQYGQEDPASADVLQRVWNTTHQQFPADSYGLVMWGHATGWVPADLNIMNQRSKPLTEEGISWSQGMERQIWKQMPNALPTKSYGGKMEISELASALPEGRKIEFMLFDACFMSSIEALYDLRNTAQYIIASPTEVMGNGFPYADITPMFFQKSLNLQGICQAFVDSYRYSSSIKSASVALINTSALEPLAETVHDIYTANPDPQVDLSRVQHYESLSYHVFYDLEDYLKQFADGTTQFEAFQSQLAKTVVYSDCTDWIYSVYGSMFQCVDFSGISTYAPQDVFPVYGAAHAETAWAQATGQSN